MSTGEEYKSLVIRDAMIVNGKGTPPYGPCDIVVEEGKIKEIINVDSISLTRYNIERPEAEKGIEAKGMYVIPGLVLVLSHINEPAIFFARCTSSGSSSFSSGSSTVVGFPGTMTGRQSVISHVFNTSRTNASWLIVNHPYFGCDRISVDKNVNDASGFLLSNCFT